MKICVIPARGGSKRIPGKNINAFNGKPVIAYPIEAALHSGLFDKVIVSTDDAEISEIAKNYGAEVPFVRPAELADDYASTISVLKHAVDWLLQQGQTVEHLACLYPVNPFVDAELLQSVSDSWHSEQFDACYGVCEFESAPQRAFQITPEGVLTRLYPEFTKVRTQDLSKTYFDSGMFYFFKVSSLFGTEAVSELNIQPYLLAREIVHDIDTLQDWKMAERWHQVNALIAQGSEWQSVSL